MGFLVLEVESWMWLCFNNIQPQYYSADSKFRVVCMNTLNYYVAFEMFLLAVRYQVSSSVLICPTYICHGCLLIECCTL